MVFSLQGREGPLALVISQVTARDGEIVHCDIGWCLSPAVALLSLYPASAAHLDMVRLRSRVAV